MEQHKVHNYLPYFPNGSSSSTSDVGYAIGPQTSPLPPHSNPHDPKSPTIPNPKKRTGRPLGSKNKPKDLKSIFLNIPPRHDVIKEVRNFAFKNQLDVAILAGSGMVSNVTFRNFMPYHNLRTETHMGTFSLIAVTGTVVTCPLTSSMIASSGHISISIAGSSGNVVGGMIEGSLTAESEVVLTVVTFKNARICKLPEIKG